jgi:hypothetical protein
MEYLERGESASRLLHSSTDSIAGNRYVLTARLSVVFCGFSRETMVRSDAGKRGLPQAPVHRLIQDEKTTGTIDDGALPDGPDYPACGDIG